MQDTTAVCGVVCMFCPAFIATQKMDEDRKIKLAEAWSANGDHFEPEDMNCDACLSVNGRLSKIAQTCEVRTCALEKGLKNCVFCAEYPCDKLSEIFGIHAKV